MNNVKNMHGLDAKKAEAIHWYDWPALLLLAILAVVVFAQFFTRYVLNDSWAWTEEVSRYLLIGVVFSGCLSVVFRREHIRLEAVESWVDTKNIKPMRLFSGSVSTLYYGFLAIAAFLLASESTQDLVSLALPKAAIYAFISIALMACAWVSLRNLISTVTKPARHQSDQSELNHD